jgi:hypothetical protein
VELSLPALCDLHAPRCFFKKKNQKKKNIAKLTKDNLTNFAGLSL